MSLEVEELAGVLLTHLNSCPNQVSGIGGVTREAIFAQGFFTNLRRELRVYEEKLPEVEHALMEAWAWLVREAFLVERRVGKNPANNQPEFFISRRGKLLKLRDDFEAYRKASLLPKGQVHPLIAARVYPSFLRGEYDTAIFQAFREVEVAVRKAGSFNHGDYGTDLMRSGFKPVKKEGSLASPGPLTDTLLPVAEQEAMANLFAGAIGLYKNPQSHRNVATDATDAAEVIMLASQLLRIVDRRKPSPGETQ